MVLVVFYALNYSIIIMISYALSASIIVTISSAFRAMCLTPKSLCNCSSLKPHVTPMHSRPEFLAVATSTSENLILLMLVVPYLVLVYAVIQGVHQ